MTGPANEFDRLDPLEAELAALRPAEPSAGLFDRIGRELDVPARKPWSRAWYVGPIAAAACVAIALLARRGGGTRHPEPVIPVVSTLPSPATTGPDEADLPALATYRRAWTRSPAALDELLDRHASRSLYGGTRTTAAAGITGTFDLIPR